jgi:hypothetical protein
VRAPGRLLALGRYSTAKAHVAGAVVLAETSSPGSGLLSEEERLHRRELAHLVAPRLKGGPARTPALSEFPPSSHDAL